MQVFNQVLAMQLQIQAWKRAGHSIGLVPTMGNLHQGHLSLVKIAQQKCDKVIVSIFVNPMQFGPNEDFDNYPRTFEADQMLLSGLQTDAVFYPSVEEMYPSGLTQTKVQVPAELTGFLEGANRPGHFDGVTTVVSKLFNMVQPDAAIFGQKDYQQLAVIKKMVKELAYSIEIFSAPIKREIDGLAMSSRNQYLNEQQRHIAPKLYTVLKDIEVSIESGNQQFNQLCKAASDRLLSEGFDAVDYIQVCNASSLLPINDNNEKKVILAVVRLGKTRLLDNILLSN